MAEFKRFASLGFDTEQAALYQRLQEFLFDRPDTSLSFSQRLARENNWSLEFAERAIAEYKRFAFLAVVAGHPVTPSDQVDQVWHLHLTYTRSYWEEFCTQVLQRPLHHEPTRGGQAEGQKFDEWYGKTLDSYQQWFGEFPPVELWPLPSDRFGRDLNFIRVNTQQNWVLSKPTLGVIRLRPQVALILPLLVLLVGCQAAANPLNFTGPEFLTFYIVLIVVGLPLAFWLRNYLRQPDGDPRRPFLKLNDYETAYLAGGAGRVVDTAIASLVQQRSVKVLPSGILSLEQSVNPSRSFVEKSVAAEIEGDQPLWQIQQTAEKKTGSIRDRLVQLGLVLTQAQAQKARLYPILLLLTLLGLGVAKIAVGLSREKPVSFLIFLCFVVTVWGLGLFKALPQRTRYGDRVLADLRDRFQRSNISSDDPQLPLLFALFGPEILVGSPFTDLESVFPVYSSRGGSDSGGGGIGGGGDSGGSSGCGGGGCGGCGGCGS